MSSCTPRSTTSAGRQAEKLVARHLLPRWGKLKAAAITRADVRAVMARIGARLSPTRCWPRRSAIFSWAVRQEILAVNPVAGVDRNPTANRERVLSDAEIKVLWPRLDSGAEVDPADRPAARRGRRHVSRAHRRRLVADAGQAARRLAGDQERQGSPGLAIGASAGADRGPSCRSAA